MKKRILSVLAFVLLFLTSYTQPETQAQHDERMEWWREARFGMFIHWGLYAIPAGEWSGNTGYGEWIRHAAVIPLEVYDTFPKKFNPVRFDADEWARIARDAGMKYIVITSKHHDGFAMFDSEQTGFDIMNTPYGMDPMKDLAAACKKYGLKFCFYYSIMDWHHPDYLPRRGWETDRSTEGADYNRYMEYMKAQLKELLTNYGEIGVLWFDGEWENTWNDKRGKEIYNYVRALQPSAIINNRVGAGRMDLEGVTKEGFFGGDFGTPEQQIPATGLPGVDWETCMTMNEHWGYNKADKKFKSTSEIIRMLADIASKGGNYLLNVGPTDEGLFPQESIDRLRDIGKWMTVNGEAIYGTTASPVEAPEWGRITRKDEKNGVTLYLHVFDWPAGGTITVRGILNKPAKAYLLSDPGRKPLEVKRNEDALSISLPSSAPDTVNTVIALELKGKLDETEPPLIESAFDILIDSLKVMLSSDREDVEIRFTVDGTEPSINSLLYVGPLKVKASCTISARCFRKGEPVSGTSRKQVRLVLPYAAKMTKNPVRGITYQYFEGTFDSLSQVKSSTPVKEGVLDSISLVPRDRDELFAMIYSGYVNIPERSVYDFYVESDDGSRLYIDDMLVADNDEVHGTQERHGAIALNKGFHKIRVEFFERTSVEFLNLSIRSTTMPKQKLPADWLYYQPKE